MKTNRFLFLLFLLLTASVEVFCQVNVKSQQPEVIHLSRIPVVDVRFDSLSGRFSDDYKYFHKNIFGIDSLILARTAYSVSYLEDLFVQNSLSLPIDFAENITNRFVALDTTKYKKVNAWVHSQDIELNKIVGTNNRYDSLLAFEISKSDVLKKLYNKNLTEIELKEIIINAELYGFSGDLISEKQINNIYSIGKIKNNSLYKIPVLEKAVKFVNENNSLIIYDTNDIRIGLLTKKESSSNYRGYFLDSLGRISNIAYFGNYLLIQNEKENFQDHPPIQIKKKYSKLIILKPLILYQCI